MWNSGFLHTQRWTTSINYVVHNIHFLPETNVTLLMNLIITFALHVHFLNGLDKHGLFACVPIISIQNFHGC